MAKKKVNISYDIYEDILHFFSGEKVRDSIEIGDFVIDISHNDKIIGWQINNASKVLNLSKNFISNIKSAYLRTVYSKELVYIAVVYLAKSEKGEKLEKELMMPVPQQAVSR